MIPEIKLRESKIRKLEKQLTGFVFIRRKAKQRKLNTLKEAQFNTLDNYLFESNEDYRKLAQKVVALFKTNNIQFSVKAEVHSFAGSFTTRVKGLVKSNGLSYLHATSSNSLFGDSGITRGSYPSELSGKVDHFGRMELKTTKTGFAVLKNLPKRFIGTIDEEGNGRVKNGGNSYDIINNGDMVMQLLIGNHFAKSPEKKKIFEQNKSKLSGMVHQLWKEVRAEM